MIETLQDFRQVRRATFERREEEIIASCPADCYQNGALISNLRSGCRLAQSAMSYSSFYFLGSLSECAALFPSGSGRDARRFRNPGAEIIPDRSRHLGGQFAPAEAPAALTSQSYCNKKR